MKIKFFSAILSVAFLSTLNAQDTSFGATAGFYSLTVKASSGEFSNSVNGSGFYAGFFADIEISESLSIRPELQFGTTSSEGESIEQLLLPIMFKYNISEDFNLQAGPQLDFIVSESEGANSFGLGLGIGAGYNISEKFYIVSRYAFGLSNRLEDAPSDTSIKFNTFQVGIGYRF